MRVGALGASAPARLARRYFTAPRFSLAFTVSDEKPIARRFLLDQGSRMGSGPVRPPLLGKLETAVMNYLWDGGDGEVKAVHDALGRPRRITLNTIHSTLKRLFEKELLARDKVSHAHVYRPRVSREEFQRSTLSVLIAELMGGRADAMVSAFVDLAERAGPKHLARLGGLIAERRRASKVRR